MPLSPGALIGGKYRIVRLIGDGGMGAVYEARHEVLGVPVALKFLHGELTRRSGLATRFLQEAKVSASIQSPHVTRVTDVDTTHDGSPFMVMELLVGETLQQLLDRRRKLPIDQAVDFALQTLAGLEAAHALGVVHRDLKPDNIFITPSSGGPVVKLLDFGIAKLRQGEGEKGLTRPGAVMGTPEYMAPEQFYAAERVDHRADIYSLGAILYEMLSGERPSDGEDAQQIVGRVLAGGIRRVTEHEGSIPEGLADFVHKALASDRNQRFESAMQMRLALAPFAGELSHAGRLAAIPVPAASIPSLTPAPAEPSRAPSVPSTLPPDDGATRNEAAPAATHDATYAFRGSTEDAPRIAKGGTQEAPHALAEHLARQSVGPAPPAAPAAAVPHSPSAQYYTAAQQYRPLAPRKAPALGALLALLLGALLAAGIITFIVLGRRPRDETANASLASGEPPQTTLTAQVDASSSEPPAPREPGAPPPAPQATAGTHPPRGESGARDAGAKADAGSFPSWPTFPLPSGIPSLPSGFPQLPTSFPELPGLPFPAPPASGGPAK
jgi:serine/threonine protein kinase